MNPWFWGPNISHGFFVARVPSESLFCFFSLRSSSGVVAATYRPAAGGRRVGPGRQGRHYGPITSPEAGGRHLALGSPSGPSRQPEHGVDRHLHTTSSTSSLSVHFRSLPVTSSISVNCRRYVVDADSRRRGASRATRRRRA